MVGVSFSVKLTVMVLLPVFSPPIRLPPPSLTDTVMVSAAAPKVAPATVYCSEPRAALT